MVIIEVSLDVEIFKPVESYSKDGLEMTNCLLMTLGREAFWDAKLFEPLVLYLGDGLEMAISNQISNQ